MIVLIGGLMHRQAHQIEQECPPGIELRFVHTDDHSPKQWIQMAKHVDVCIVMTKFVSHKHTECVTAAGVKVTVCHGGTGRLKAMLKELAP